MMCDIPCAVKISKLWSWRHEVCKTQPRFQGLSYRPLLVVGRKILLAIMAAERNNWRSGKFFVTGGPVSASCKTPLTRKALYCLYFRKTKSEEHTVCDLLEYTGQTAKRRSVRVMFPLSCSVARAKHERNLTSSPESISSEPRAKPIFFLFFYLVPKKIDCRK